MNTSFDASSPPGGAVIALREVTLPLVPPFDVGLGGVSLSLSAGELAMGLLEHGAEDHPLADVMSGLVVPETGEVLFAGQDWRALDADAAASARHRIGRVFERHGWLSNLDVDENMLLAERYHTARSIEALHEEALFWAGLAGLVKLPATRPSVTERAILRRAEWVRAALGSPWLLLLERPGRGLADGWRGALARLVNEARGRGTAVVWLCEGADEWNDPTLKPSLKFRAEGNTLVQVDPA